MTVQYTSPVTTGESSPDVTATMTSSSSAIPSVVFPNRSKARPPPEPAQRGRHPGTVDESVAEPHGAASRTRNVATVQILVMRARPELVAVFVPAEQKRDCREAFEILGLEWSLAIGLGEPC